MIQQQVKDIDIVTVTIASDPKDPQGIKLKMFYCCNCQAQVCQYIGKILSIAPGLPPARLPVLKKCKNKRHEFESPENPKGTCNTVFYFQPIL